MTAICLEITYYFSFVSLPYESYFYIQTTDYPFTADSILEWMTKIALDRFSGQLQRQIYFVPDLVNGKCKT